MVSIKYTGLLLLLAGSAKAQSFSFSDLFGQAGKQKQYYMQQLAAYTALRSELRQGYQVMRNGLGGIRDINTAELNAHTAYYSALRTPSGAVRNSPLVSEILAYQQDITVSFGQTFSGLSSDELSYVAAVKSEVLMACNLDLTDLQNLLAAGKMQLSDAERLKRLQTIHAAMLDKSRFTRSFTNSVKLLAIRRQQSINDTQTLRRLYENH